MKKRLMGTLILIEVLCANIFAGTANPYATTDIERSFFVFLNWAGVAVGLGTMAWNFIASALCETKEEKASKIKTGIIYGIIAGGSTQVALKIFEMFFKK
jgi:hypothetical protein